MKLAWLAVVFILGSSYSSIAQQSESCEGPRQQHDLGTDVFTTSSRVIEQRGSIVYETCVENSGTRDLWINWNVPGPISYVPPGRAVTSQRFFPTLQSINAVACLEYGSLAKIIQEKYVGHEDDREKLDREQSEGCRHSSGTASSQVQSNSFEAVASKVRLFVPSDRERPADTMLEFVADVEASYAKGLPIGQTIRYSVHPLDARRGGNAKAMSIRLAADAAMNDWTSVSEPGLVNDGAQLGSKNEFNLMLNVGDAPVLKNVRYEIFDENQKLVGAFDAPVWADLKGK